MKRVLIPGVILCGADLAVAAEDNEKYTPFFEQMTVYAPVPVPVNGCASCLSEAVSSPLSCPLLAECTLCGTGWLAPCEHPGITWAGAQPVIRVD